jgi:hypothetical protein
VSDDPVNSAMILQNNMQLVSAGGINARDVTTTRSQSNFAVNFFDVASCKLIGGYKTLNIQ